MKVKDLLEEINRCKDKYGEDFLDWDVYTEQLDNDDKFLKTKSMKGWERVTDGEGWEYFKCFGFSTKFPEKKIFTINVNY